MPFEKPNFTAEVRPLTRTLAIVLLLPTTFIFSAGFVAAVAMFIIDFQGMPRSSAIASAAVFGFFTFVSGWMLIRLLRKVRASNGRTVMPEWFIQMFGAVFLVGLFIVAIVERAPLVLVECMGIFGAMLGIRRLLRASQDELNEIRMANTSDANSDQEM